MLLLLCFGILIILYYSSWFGCCIKPQTLNRANPLLAHFGQKSIKMSPSPQRVCTYAEFAVIWSVRTDGQLTAELGGVLLTANFGWSVVFQKIRPAFHNTDVFKQLWLDEMSDVNKAKQGETLNCVSLWERDRNLYGNKHTDQETNSQFLALNSCKAHTSSISCSYLVCDTYKKPTHNFWH